MPSFNEIGGVCISNIEGKLSFGVYKTTKVSKGRHPRVLASVVMFEGTLSECQAWVKTQK